MIRAIFLRLIFKAREILLLFQPKDLRAIIASSVSCCCGYFIHNFYADIKAGQSMAIAQH